MEGGTSVASNENYGSTATAETGRRSLTSSRLINLLMIMLYGVSMVFNITCLSVMVIKYNEIVDKFGSNISDDDKSEWCILFIDYDEEEPAIKIHNNKCHLVIYGSAALAGCAFLMMIFLLIRTLLFRKSGFLAVVDGVEIALTGLFAAVLAVIVTLGKKETCDSFEKFYKDTFTESKSCSEIYIPTGNNHVFQVYQALLTTQITSWVAVILLFVLGMITGMRVLLWMAGSRHRRKANLEQSLVSHDELQEAHVFHDNDDEPLPI